MTQSHGTQPPPVPREVEVVHSNAFLYTVLCLGLVVAIPVTVYSLGVVANDLLLRTLGREVTARVLSAEEAPDWLSGGYDRRATYAYALPHTGGGERVDSARIAWREWNRLSLPHATAAGRPERIAFTDAAPAEIAVRAYSLGPLANSRADEDDFERFYLPIGALFAAVFGFLIFALYLHLVPRPRRYKRLFTHGVAVPGQVVDRWVRVSKFGPHFHIRYAFIPEGSTTPMTATTTLPGGRVFEKTPIGEPITVLHEPGNPKYNAIYEHGGFRWVRAGSGE